MDTSIKSCIIKSQRCQRNWDLSKTISEEDLDILETAVTLCPSKQNIVFYTPYFIQNRELVNQIHDATDGFTINYETKESCTNSQSLANLLVLFVENREWINSKYRNEDTLKSQLALKETETVKNDKLLSIGVAAGYLNLSASILGLSTGFCSCFDNEKIKEILNIKNNILLLIGIGYPDEQRNCREHHLDNRFIFPSFLKKIEVTRL